MKNSGVVWNEESLDKFLTKPRKFIPKTKMSFRGIKKKSLRDDLISFLKSNG
jgi:cytochrome c